MVLSAAPRACGPGAHVLRGPVRASGSYLTSQGLFGATPMPDCPRSRAGKREAAIPGAGGAPPATFRSREADPAATVRPAPARALTQRSSLAGARASPLYRRPARDGAVLSSAQPRVGGLPS